ncbi:helix-turn-helix domain-containing protein [Neobacillus sp. SuZ13]|uniref:helix-turn-helix domain-containing protein n=1 Tax=Neobacillus sp. SuZ13 TaxID=3047875 RepID=UPI0024BFBADE|nr:helix-turn-helix domain-containing protein [Neobacillus sp. SuZ13]WHY66592.1 helix-turn-helix domain-containing protein [Neobacillus sp. SuZ13]
MKQDSNSAAFSHLLLSGTLVHEGTFTELQQKFGISIHPHLVMVISIDRYPDMASGNSLEWKKEVGQQLVGKIEETVSIPFLWNWIEEGVLALLLELEEQDSVNVFNRNMVHMAKEIQLATNCIDLSVSIGIGRYYRDPYALYQSFLEARKSMSGRFFQGNQLIFHYEMKRNNEEPLINPFNEEKAELLALVKIGDIEGIILNLKQLMEKLAVASHFNEDIFKTEVVSIVLLLSKRVIDSGANAITIHSNNTNFIQNLYHIIRYDKCVKQVCEYAVWLTEQSENTNRNEVTPLIQQAIRYIKENHQKSISLNEVAQYCCLSRHHFSHLFKKEVGSSLIDYLNRMRIDMSLSYLEMTDLPISEIAARIGFDDANYFSRMFKKYMEFSPSDYRIARNRTIK